MFKMISKFKRLSSLPAALCMVAYLATALIGCKGLSTAATTLVDVGVILDMDTYTGKMGSTCIDMAMEDFYSAHGNYNSRLVLHKLDSKTDSIEAASAAIELLKYYQVKAIIGPQKTRQADFVAGIANRSQVPTISFSATGSSLTRVETPYFVRMAQVDSNQLQAVAAIAKAHNWRQITLVYEGTTYGNGIVSYLGEAMAEVNVRIAHRCSITPLMTDDQILKEMYKMMTMQTRVFLVHMLASLASRVFLKAKEAGMMSKGYAWIVTDGIASTFSDMDPRVVNSMQGVLGVKSYLPPSEELTQFASRFEERFQQGNSTFQGFQLNDYGVWAYDTISTLAMAIERVGDGDLWFKRPAVPGNSSDIESVGVFEQGPEILQFILRTNFAGLSGQVNLETGELPMSPFQIVNMVGNDTEVIGFWSKDNGITTDLPATGPESESEILQKVVWPGNTTQVPKGWQIPTNENRLRVGVPVKAGFSEFINVQRNPRTKAPQVTGYCADVFEAVIKNLPYAVLCDYIPYETYEGSDESAGSYDDLIQGLPKDTYDVVVGDITIRANRTQYADFSLPYTESGVTMIVPVRFNDGKMAWIFLKPLTMELWLMIGAFFVYIGLVIWVIEHRVNKAFRGPRRKQIGMIFWFSFSTLVFAHKEKVLSNLSKFVVIVWVFAVLVLTSSYTANLTSMLTVRQLQPTITDVNDIINSKEDLIGYQNSSFVLDLLRSLNVSDSKMVVLNTREDYDNALSRGSKNGGVSAIMDEIPYLRLVLANNCSKYEFVGPIYKTAGFGFAFPIGSPLVSDVSRVIVNLTEQNKTDAIRKFWLGDDLYCSSSANNDVSSNSLTLDSFKGLFLIAGITTTSALCIFLYNFLMENTHVLNSDAAMKQKIETLMKIFNEKKEDIPDSTNKKAKEEEAAPEKPEVQLANFDDIPRGFIIKDTSSPSTIRLSIQEEGVSTTGEGRASSSSSGPGTPYQGLNIDQGR
ncbi:hypothetical protein MLD38_005573 [Melastoma candidum]|uniref:Uncharacterized protein n=1 Tax=Melastoma candidum TaxID=119954 RepID=A0ACB9RN49_9MYRT|nr:hypothetical protein MLD38_005573 [Melastoma candidum]